MLAVAEVAAIQDWVALAGQAAAEMEVQVSHQLQPVLQIQAAAVAADMIVLDLLAVLELLFFLFQHPVTLEQQLDLRLSPQAVPTQSSSSRLQGATQHEPFCQSSGW